MRTIIGLTGLIGSGKTTVAKYLANKHNFCHVKFAHGLKSMCWAIGLTEEETDGSKKEEPSDLLLGMTPRRFMQLLGTEFGRNMIHPDLWISIWLKQLDNLIDTDRFVVDDVRFPNEANAIKSASKNSHLVRVIRTDTTQGAHASELQTFKTEWVLENNFSIEELYRKADTMVALTVPDAN